MDSKIFNIEDLLNYIGFNEETTKLFLSYWEEPDMTHYYTLEGYCIHWMNDILCNNILYDIFENCQSTQLEFANGVKDTLLPLLTTEFSKESLITYLYSKESLNGTYYKETIIREWIRDCCHFFPFFEKNRD